jgi:uncharacterized membrane protein
MTDVSPPPATAASRLRRWLVPALVTSLSLNLLVAGFMLGHALDRARHRPFGGPGMYGAGGPIGRFIGSLPPDRRAVVEGALAEQRNVFETLTPDVRQARRTFSDSLRASPFDRTKLETALHRLADAEHALRTASAGATSQLVEKLTDRERDQLERMLRRFTSGGDQTREPAAPNAP